MKDSVWKATTPQLKDSNKSELALVGALGRLVSNLRLRGQTKSRTPRLEIKGARAVGLECRKLI